ncbi:MAG: M28 family peptidase [Planctomycetota bacterium]|nr:M28 family peptidase [Planctomycetota bacterium]MDA1113034.1 M28 family peptidase [Planctomycetota bacterium]
MHPTPITILIGILFGGLCLISPSCGDSQARAQTSVEINLKNGQAPDFDEERAFEDLRFLCEEIGPRRIGTKGLQQTTAWLQAQMAELEGWNVSLDTFKAQPPAGARRQAEVDGVNVLARRTGTEPGEIWICSHYDTYDYPGFVGANDAGSSTVVLLELARQWAGKEEREGQTLVLAWFDGEERFPPIPWQDFTNSTFGSRDLAERMFKEETIDGISALILLDMIGDAQLGVLKEQSSDSMLKQIMERTAGVLGDPNLFVGQRDIQDDHIHFRRRNVPSINLIDFNYGPGNSYWHTREDNMEHVSAKSLGRIGRLILAALPAVEREFSPRE